MWYEYLFVTIVILCGVAFNVSIIKSACNEAPDGRAFVKKFSKKIHLIQKAQKRENLPFIPGVVRERLFKVRILDDNTPEGLEYKTIPRYTSKTVYIDDEPVCRIHKFREKEYVEISSDRKADEVIYIVEKAFEVADKAENEFMEKFVAEHFRTKTFFD